MCIRTHTHTHTHTRTQANTRAHAHAHKSKHTPEARLGFRSVCFADFAAASLLGGLAIGNSSVELGGTSGGFGPRRTGSVALASGAFGATGSDVVGAAIPPVTANCSCDHIGYDC